MIETPSNRIRADDSKVCLLGIGGAGAKSASEIARDLPLPLEAIMVDRHPHELRRNSYGAKVPVGYPLYSQRHENGLAPDDLVDETDLLRVRSAVNGFRRVYVLMGLGGQATLELAPSVIKVAKEVATHVTVICTMPFTFEGPMRRKVAEDALKRIGAFECPVAVADADVTLSATVGVGNVAEELTRILARAFMTLLTVDNNVGVGALNAGATSVQTIDRARKLFVGHGVAEAVEELRRAARDAVKNPITSGLKLSDADNVNVTIAVPSDMPVKSLNSVMGVIERELDDDAQIATSFVPLAPNSKKVRVSIVAGDSRDRGAENNKATEMGASEVEFHPLDPDAAVEAAEQALTADEQRRRNGHVDAETYRSAGVLI